MNHISRLNAQADLETAQIRVGGLIHTYQNHLVDALKIAEQLVKEYGIFAPAIQTESSLVVGRHVRLAPLKDM